MQETAKGGREGAQKEEKRKGGEPILYSSLGFSDSFTTFIFCEILHFITQLFNYFLSQLIHFMQKKVYIYQAISFLKMEAFIITMTWWGLILIPIVEDCN